MKNSLLLLLVMCAMYSCTIQKRRYFDGYHVEWRGNESRAQSNSPKATCPELVTLSQDPAEVMPSLNEQIQQPLALANVELDTSTSTIRTKNYMLAEEDIAESVDISYGMEEKSKTSLTSATSKETRSMLSLVFRVLSIISFAGALLFLASAIFAVDSLVLTVLLLIGGGLVLLGLLFWLISNLANKKSAVGHINGFQGEEEVAPEKFKKPMGAFFAFLVAGLLTSLVYIALSSPTLELAALIGYFVLAVLLTAVCLFLIGMTIYRIIIKRRLTRTIPEPKEKKD